FAGAHPPDVESTTGVGRRLDVDAGRSKLPALVRRLQIVIGDPLAAFVEFLSLDGPRDRDRRPPERRWTGGSLWIQPRRRHDRFRRRRAAPQQPRRGIAGVLVELHADVITLTRGQRDGAAVLGRGMVGP